MSEPRHTHDCEHCEFLGVLNGMDSYACSRDGGTSYLLRYGNDGSEYYSTFDSADTARESISRKIQTLGMDDERRKKFLKRVACIRLHADMIAAEMAEQEAPAAVIG